MIERIFVRFQTNIRFETNVRLTNIRLKRIFVYYFCTKLSFVVGEIVNINSHLFCVYFVFNIIYLVALIKLIMFSKII